MNKNFFRLMFAVALTVGAATSFVSCTDNEADVKTELQGQFSSGLTNALGELADAKAKLQEQIKDLNEQIAKIASCGTNCDSKINSLKEQVTTLEGKINGIGDIEKRLTNFEKELKEFENFETNINSTLNGWLAGKGGDILALLKDDINSLIDNKGYVTESKVNGLIKDSLANALAGLVDADKVKTIVEGYGYLTRDSLENYLGDYLTDEELQTALEAYVKADELKAEVQSIVEEYGYITSSDLANELEQRGFLTAEDVKDFVKGSEVASKIDSILATKDYVTQDTLDVQLDSLYELITSEVDAKVNALEVKTRTMLRNLLSSMITGIEINATENPLFGSASLPADIRTTILGAYYGRASEGILFPEDDVAKQTGVTQQGWDAGDTLFNEETGNAGKLYLTINPNTVDFEGQLVKLVTSQGNESPIKLDAVKGSDKELSFGYSRAINANGFYEAAATLNVKDIKDNKVNIDFKEMAMAAETVIQQRSKSSIAELASTLLNAVSKPAYAVQATWVDSIDTDAETNVAIGTTHNITSQYAIAAVAVHPLSFSFMKGHRIPGIERIENFVGDAINRMFNQIKEIIPDFSDLGEVKLKKIELRGSTKEALKHMNVEFEIPEGKITGEIQEDQVITIIGEDGEERGTAIIKGITFANNECKLTVEFDLLEYFETVFDDMNESLDFDEVNKALARLSELSNLSSDLNDLRDRLKNGIFDYIDRLNNRFSKLVDSALLPCLLYTDGNGNIGRVTTSILGTQVTGTSITLAPTSYTAELFAPAFKKFIAVTDISGNSTKTAADINAANNDFGKVLSGNAGKIVTLNGLEKGCTYEITYSALDYYGEICTKKYYISVK